MVDFNTQKTRAGLEAFISNQTTSQIVQSRLCQFCQQYCNISAEKMEEHLLQGKKLETLLTDSKVTLQDLEKEGWIKPESVVALMWLLTAKTAYSTELYTNGSMRLGNGEKVRDFIQACGGPSVYARISTHFRENLGKEGILKADKIQWGIDLNDMGLPAKKNTLLFALQPDGTLFLKLEEYGCPPFWKKGFRTFDHFKEFMGHAINYLRSRVVNKPKSGLKFTRKEHVPPKITKEFQKVMQFLYPPSGPSWFSHLTSMSSEGKRLYKEGKTYGISKMQSILEDGTLNSRLQKLTPKQAIQRAELIRKIEEFNKRPSGYQGEIKGQEVLLPPLGTTLLP
jgi:hypothetical protein